MNSINFTDKSVEHAWFPLDNAAKIFPAVRSKEHTTVFRISVTLTERINLACLLNAIRKVEDRFPYFMVSLKKGFFWYYLEHVDNRLVPIPDNYGICRAFNSSLKDPLLLRILAIRNRISVEFSHILTDGTGGMTFLMTLLTAYFDERGIQVNNPGGISTESIVMDEEFEDAYKQYFRNNIPHVPGYAKAFHLPFKIEPVPAFSLLVAEIAMNEIKREAQKMETSITEYLVAVYLFVLQEIHAETPRYSRFRKRKILRVQVPVNLRKLYPTRSMRNFSLFVLPEIDLRLGHYSFEEIAKIVHYKMKLETDEKLINKIISRNVGGERNYLVRGIPLIVKNLILYYKYYSQGTNQYSGVMTNLGRLDVPKEIIDKIDHFLIVPPPPNRKLKTNCGVAGFKDKLVLSFGSITRSRTMERKFIDFLIRQGIHVKLTDYK